jgi:hypothetical protein
MSEKEIEVKNVAEAQEKLADFAKDSSINKPSEEETLAAEKKFDEAAKAFNIKLFTIGTEEEAMEVSDFLLTFLDKFVYWTKNGWMGVLKLHEEITEFKKNYKDGPYGLGYQALEFLFFALTNPGGSGLATAREIEKVAEMYGKMVEYAGKKLELARAELKEIQYLQEEWNAMLQGFYLVREDGVEIEETITKEAEPEHTTQSAE